MPASVPAGREEGRLISSGRAVLTLAALTATLLLPAAYNGYPLVFSDSGEYVPNSGVLTVPPYRTIGYTLWIAATEVGASLWTPVAAQSALLAALLVLLARTLVPRLPVGALLGGGVALALLTAASSRASQLMPDVFAPIMVVALYLVVAQWDPLGRAGRWVAVIALATAVIMHTTHVALAAGLLGWYAVLALRRRGGSIRPTDVARAAMIAGAGVALLVGINYSQTGRAFVSRNGHVFVLGHLVESGLASRLLVAECPRVRYALCPFQGALIEQGVPLSSADFVWRRQSPLHRIGGWAGSREEASRMLRGSLRHDPLRHVVIATRYSARQLVAVGTLDGLESYAGVAHVEQSVGYRRPADLAAFRTARQQRATLGLAWLARVHEGVLLLSALASVWLVLTGPRAERFGPRTTAGLHVTVWLVLVGNAVLCANLSGVYDRYQARLAWLLPLAVMLSLAERRWTRVESRVGSPITS